ncbi:unnamed protein product [Cylicocyclus nassatus]|uniref:Uncharacterized protein n=1 Tax=Cylicocyclus nassatus TaxID=53992 RepID=A0AA36HE36_CYLNA|nr:unnamed protein product [Cylicocyclus nassatus]
MLYLEAIFILLLLLCTPHTSYECQSPAQMLDDCFRKCVKEHSPGALENEIYRRAVWECQKSCYEKHRPVFPFPH